MEIFNNANSYNNASMNSYYQIPPCMRSAQAYSYPFAFDQGYRFPSLPDAWTFGPIKIEWTFNGESINVALKMFENAVRDVLLTLSKPSINITTDIADTSVNLTLSADFVKNNVTLSGVACFDTVCTTFNNTVVASW